MKIAISGKGGVGKTTIMAMIAQALKKKGNEVLIIDADPSPHMAQTIGVANPEEITPIADMKKMLTERAGKVEGSPFYNINPKIDDLPTKFMVETQGLKLMVLGAIETAEGGCACAENTVLKRLLTKLLLSPSQTILLDMEAGVEHLGRGTIAGVDNLLIVVIPTRSSIRTSLKIKRLALESGIDGIFFVGNKVEDQEDQDFLKKGLGEEPIAFFPNSNAIRKAERSAQPLTTIADIPEQALTDVLSKLAVNC